MFCHKCGEQLPDGSGFCHKCGTKMIGNEAAPKQIHSQQSNQYSVPYSNRQANTESSFDISAISAKVAETANQLSSKTKKRIVSIGIGAIALIALIAMCTNTGGNNSGNNNVNSNSRNNIKTIADASGTVGSYYVELKSYRIEQTRVMTTDYDILMVTLQWTNNSDSSTSFWSALNHKAFQNGVECNEHGWLVESVPEMPIESQQGRDIQPGSTQTVRVQYELLNKSSPVTIEISNYSGTFTYIINIS